MPKVAYLTIDDAPSEEMREKVDFLTSMNIPAIRFCIGSLLEKRLDDRLREIDEDAPERGRGLHFMGSSDIIATHDFPGFTAPFAGLIERLLENGIRFEPPRWE